MNGVLINYDFRAADRLEEARMFYEGGACSCGYYTLRYDRLDAECDTPLLTAKPNAVFHESA